MLPEMPERNRSNSVATTTILKKEEGESNDAMEKSNKFYETKRGAPCCYEHLVRKD